MATCSANCRAPLLNRPVVTNTPRAAVGLGALQGADEGLHLGALDCGVAVVALGLYADQIESKGVLADHAVEAAVARSAGVCQQGLAPPVAHGAQQQQAETFEEQWRLGEYSVEQLGCQGSEPHRYRIRR
jgi:hypothetical protein